MKNALKKLFGTIAPVLASAVGGPLAGSAIQVIANALGIQADAPDVEDQIVAKMETATAADWILIKQAEQTFLLEMRKADISEEQIYAMDRDSARKREIALPNDYTNKALAFSTVLIFAGTIFVEFYLLFDNVTVDPGIKAMLDISLGILLKMTSDVFGYYFGSSSGSAVKTAMSHIGK